MPQTNKPLFNDPTLQDTFENLSDQGSGVISGLQDLAAPKSDQTGGEDNGIEQLGGQKQDDPVKQLQQAQKQGLSPQQLAEKREEEKKKIEFYQTQVKGWDEHYQQAMKEEEMKKKQAEEEERKKKEQEIVELRQEEAKNAALNPQKVDPNPGRGTAFIPTAQQKTSMGTGELRNTITN